MNVFFPGPMALGSLMAQHLQEHILLLFVLGMLLKVLTELCAVFICFAEIFKFVAVEIEY